MLAFLKSKLQGQSGYIIGGDDYVTHSGFRGRYEWFFDRLNRHLAEKGENPIDKLSPHSTRHADVNTATHKMLHKDLDISKSNICAISPKQKCVFQYNKTRFSNLQANLYEFKPIHKLESAQIFSTMQYDCVPQRSLESSRKYRPVSRGKSLPCQSMPQPIPESMTFRW